MYQTLPLDDILDQTISEWMGRKTEQHLAEGGEADKPRTFDTHDAGDKWGMAAYGGDEWVNKLTPEQRHAIKEYVVNSQRINDALRGRTDDPDALAVAQKRAPLLDEALATKPVPETVQVWRGVAAHAGRDWNAALGETWTDKGFFSASVNLNEARGHADPAEYQGGAMMRVTVPKGTPGAYLGADEESSSSEQELLLGRGLKYKIKAVHQPDTPGNPSGKGPLWGKQKYVVVDVEVVPPGQDEPTQQAEGAAAKPIARGGLIPHLAAGGSVPPPPTAQPGGANPGGWFALLGGVKTAWNAARATEHKAIGRHFAGQQGLAGAIAEERAGTPEEAAVTKKRLARADTAVRWTQWYALQGVLGAIAGPIAGGVAAKGSWYLPTASMAYTGYQLVKEALAGRNPTELLKAARARMAAGKEQQAQGQTPAHLTVGGEVPGAPVKSEAYSQVSGEQSAPPAHLAGGGAASDPPGFTPQGTDTQAANLSEGSFVVNRESSQANAGALDALGAGTVPDQPGRVADFTGGGGSAPAELTPKERVVSPGAVAAHPGLAQRINAAHGALTPRLAAAGGGAVGMPPHLAGGGAPGGWRAPPTTSPPFNAWQGLPGGTTPVAPAGPPLPPTAALAGAGGPVPVMIMGPLPLPVAIKSGAAPGGPGGTGGPGGAGGAGGEGGKPSVLPPAMGDVLARMTGGLAGTGKAIQVISTQFSGAFTKMSAGMAGLAAAGSPTLFRDLTGSSQILAGQLSGLLVPTIAKTSAGLQLLARYVERMDPALKGQIGSWAAWSAGGLAGAAALAKVASIAGGVLPILSALKTAMVFTVASPFGAALAGLGALAAFNPEVFAPIGAAVQEMMSKLASGPALEGLTRFTEAFAEAAAGLLVPALDLAVAAIKGLNDGLTALSGFLGASSADTLKMVAATALLFGPVRIATTAIVAMSAAIPALRVGLAAWWAGQISLTAALGMSTAATKVFTAALISTGIGVVAVAVSLLTAHLLQQSGAFGEVASATRDATKALKGYQEMQAKAASGGKFQKHEIEKLMNESENKEFKALGTDEKKQAYLGKKSKEATAAIEAQKKAGLLSDEEMESREAAVTRALEAAREKGLANPKLAAKGLTDPATIKAELQRELGAIGVSAGSIDDITRKTMKNLESGKVEQVTRKGVVSVEGYRFDEKGAEKASQVYAPDRSIIERLKARQDVFGAASKGGVELSPLEKIRKDYQALQGDYARAFPKVMQAQQVAPEDIRAVAQNASLNTDPIERKLTEIDLNNTKFREDLLAKLRILDKRLDDLNPRGGRPQ